MVDTGKEGKVMVMIDFFTPEMVDAVMAERRNDAGSVRVRRDSASLPAEGKLRTRLAGILGLLAAAIHSEAARQAVGLRPSSRVSECYGGDRCKPTLCLCQD